MPSKTYKNYLPLDDVESEFKDSARAIKRP